MVAGEGGGVANDPRFPAKATYRNLYKLLESDAEFVKTVAGGGGGRQHPRVVDSISCRQLYLNRYTFSRKETMPEQTKKCLDRIRHTVVRGGGRKWKDRARARRNGCPAVRRVKEFSCAAMCAAFRKLLSCTASVDVGKIIKYSRNSGYSL